MALIKKPALTRAKARRRSTGRGCVAVAALSLFAACGPSFAIQGGTSTTDFKVVGDGVQFAPNWVLTAAHVGLSPGGSYSNGWGTSLIDTVYAPPNSGTFPFNDLKLVHLSNAINGAPVVQLSSTLWTDTAFNLLNPSLNINVTLTTNSNQAPQGYAFGQLREFATSATVDIDPGPATNLQTGAVNWLVTHQNSFTAPYVQGGDSGGGLFLGHVTDSTSPLLGIASAQLNDINGANTYASAYVSVASYRTWIDDMMLLNDKDMQVALWTATPVPEPATWAMWLAGVVALTAAKRRKT